MSTHQSTADRDQRFQPRSSTETQSTTESDTAPLIFSTGDEVPIQGHFTAEKPQHER